MTDAPVADGTVARRAPFGHPVVGGRGGDTRRRILDGTMQALADHGFDAVHVEMIAERAGCSRPSFYQYFESKHDAYWALAGQLGREIVALAGRLDDVTADDEGVARLTTWIGEYMTLHEAWEPVIASFQAASRDHLQRARRSSTISLRTDEALLGAFGLAASGRNEQLMAAMVAMLDRASYYAEIAPSAVDRQPFVVALAELFHRVFVGPIDGVNVDRKRRIRRLRPPLPPPLARGMDPLPARQERTRQRLLDAGLHVLPTRGYHDTRVDDIVEVAGLSHGTFYRYFDNRDSIFRVLAEAAAGRAVDLVDRLQVDGPVDDVDAWSRDWLRTYEADGGIISTWQEMRTNAELTAFSQQVAAALFTRLVRALEQRSFGNPEADATAMLALLERLPNHVYALGFISEEAGIESMTTILRRGFFALEDQ